MRICITSWYICWLPTSLIIPPRFPSSPYCTVTSHRPSSSPQVIITHFTQRCSWRPCLLTTMNVSSPKVDKVAAAAAPIWTHLHFPLVLHPPRFYRSKTRPLRPPPFPFPLPVRLTHPAALLAPLGLIIRKAIISGHPPAPIHSLRVPSLLVSAI